MRRTYRMRRLHFPPKSPTRKVAFVSMSTPRLDGVIVTEFDREHHVIRRYRSKEKVS